MNKSLIYKISLVFAVVIMISGCQMPVYEGETTVAGVRNGQGTLTFANGAVYVGEFRRNEMTGQGTWTWGPGEWERDVYVGEFWDGDFNGQGTYTHADGGVYVGEFRRNEMTGQGTWTSANGDVSAGDFINGNLNGQGTKTFGSRQMEGVVYVGEFRNGLMNGQGTLTYPTGHLYVGEFKDEQFDGQGTLAFSNGEIYAGEFRRNEMTGHGTYTHADGGVYVGGFREGLRNGQGTFTFASGGVSSGTWRNGELVASSAPNNRTYSSTASGNNSSATNRASTSTANQNSSSGNDRIKSLCTSYGFTPNTDAHANCVMNMDMQQSAANNEARRRAAQGLYNLGIQLINGGPNTLRRSSGGNGSGRRGFLLRETVSGFNRICYYSGPSGAFAITQRAASICPAAATQP